MAEITREQLGSMATDADVAEFKTTVARILPAFDGDEQAAIDWLWEEGDYLKRIKSHLANSITLTDAEMRVLDDGQDWYKSGDEVVLGWPYDGEPDTANMMGLWVNTECHDNWTEFGTLPLSIKQRFLIKA